VSLPIFLAPIQGADDVFSVLLKEANNFSVHRETMNTAGHAVVRAIHAP
jgi:hypothetical protein